MLIQSIKNYLGDCFLVSLSEDPSKKKSIVVRTIEVFKASSLHFISLGNHKSKKLYYSICITSSDLIRKINEKFKTLFTSKKLKKEDTKVEIKNLTAAAISKMTPDQQGFLIDHHAKRQINAPSLLTSTQLKGMLRSTVSHEIKLVNEQEVGLGHCGRYAINNAFQQEILSTSDFKACICQCLKDQLSCSDEDARQLVENQEDFGIDNSIIEYILENQVKQSVKCQTIRELVQVEVSKQKAMEDFIGEAKWTIVANIGADIYEMPSALAAPYPLAKGHFIALRKDEKGEWWYIDSRAPQPINIALAIIPKSCTLLVPI